MSSALLSKQTFVTPLPILLKVFRASQRPLIEVELPHDGQIVRLQLSTIREGRGVGLISWVYYILGVHLAKYLKASHAERLPQDSSDTPVRTGGWALSWVLRSFICLTGEMKCLSRLIAITMKISSIVGTGGLALAGILLGIVLTFELIRFVLIPGIANTSSYDGSTATTSSSRPAHHVRDRRHEAERIRAKARGRAKEHQICQLHGGILRSTD